MLLWSAPPGACSVKLETIEHLLHLFNALQSDCHAGAGAHQHIHGEVSVCHLFSLDRLHCLFADVPRHAYSECSGHKSSLHCNRVAHERPLAC